jgi:hypothetical protein
MMGIMEGSNLKIMGAFAPVGRKFLIRSIESRTEREASARSMPKVNCSITILEPIFEMEVIFSMPETPERAASISRVTERSTSSGPAPG